MSVCPKCGAQMEEDAKFCAACGYAVPEETVATPAAASGETTSGNNSGNSKKKLLAVGIAAVAVILLLIIIISAAAGSGAKNYGLYAKDNALYYSKLKGEGVMISDEVGDSTIYVTEDGSRIFYLQEDGKLVWQKTKEDQEPTRISGSVDFFRINRDGSYVLYCKGSSLYRYNVNKDDAEKIGKLYQTYALRYTPDFDQLVYINDDGELILKKAGKDEICLASDAEELESVSFENKTVHYTKGNGLYRQKFGDKNGEKILKNVSVLGVLESGELYYSKTDSDSSDGYATLYYFDGKDSFELTDEFDVDDYSAYALASEQAVIAFHAGDDRELYVAVKDNEPVEIDLDDVNDYRFNASGDTLYVLADYDYDDQEGALYEVGITGKGAKEPRETAQDVMSLSYLHADDQLLYVDSDATLCMGDQKLVKDYDSIVDFGQEDVYLVSADSDGESYTLYLIANGKAKKISDDAFSACLTPKGDVLYLADYDDGEGELRLSKGSEKYKVLDKDVQMLLSPSTVTEDGYLY